jgi:ribosomal protein L40E
MADAVDPGRSHSACLRCGATIQSMGVEEFRVGGTSGGWKLLFGEFAELGEGMLKLEVLACRSCGNVELRMAQRPG